MTLYEALSLAVSVLSLILGATAHYRISMKDGNKIGRLNQSAGSRSQLAGRDING